MRIIFLLLLFIHFFPDLQSQATPNQQYRLLKSADQVQSKNYYLLTLFEQETAVKDLLEKDTELRKILHAKRDSLKNALAGCQNEAFCYTRVLKFSEAEIKAVGDRLMALYKNDNALDRLLKDHLRPSGVYILFNNLSSAELLAKAWEQDARGINFTIGVYAEGAKANYPNIDSISFDVKQRFYGMFVHTAATVIEGESKDAALFFSIPLTAALRFLEVNERMQAGDFEPMEETENKAAVQEVRNINWDRYPYSVILIPGAGPNDPATALSGEAMLRLRLGALQYKKGMAPFMVVSGGKVHPYKTKYNEAYEMKKFLTGTLGVPEKAVIIEPHARHTTTNLRNCVRLIYRYGMPFDKPALTSTSRGQSFMISNLLVARCQKELGMTPFKPGTRLSETEVVFFPLIEALHINPTEPMDP